MMKHRVEAQPGLTLRQEIVEALVLEDCRSPDKSAICNLQSAIKRVVGVLAHGDTLYQARAVILTTGTFLKALMHTGESKTRGGRAGDSSAEFLSESLAAAASNWHASRPALHAVSTVERSISTKPNCNRATSDPRPFSFATERITQPQMDCHITYTNAAVHALIRANLHRAPMYSGQIRSRGPRYCPSIEDKVVRFADKEQHQIFLEPEGRNTLEYYCNGISTSLPKDVQQAMLRHIPGLERAEILRWGYAVEYDYAPPTQLHATLETKPVRGAVLRRARSTARPVTKRPRLRDCMAGINAALKIRGEPGSYSTVARRTSACSSTTW